AVAPPATNNRDRVRRTERELAVLHKQQAGLETELASAGDDHVALARIGTDLATVADAIARAEDLWLELTVGD
ncbi:MAG: hypothetical protein M3N98_10005, partial [Actinomycetota bacterium]|nr:hypothetical protein [Actinomycetota bacterium]